MVIDNFFSNMDSYTLAIEFKQVAAQMNNCGGRVDESLLRMWFLKGLSSDYSMAKFQVQSADLSLADTYNAISILHSQELTLNLPGRHIQLASRPSENGQLLHLEAPSSYLQSLTNYAASSLPLESAGMATTAAGNNSKSLALGVQLKTQVLITRLKLQQRPTLIWAATTARNTNSLVASFTPLLTAFARTMYAPYATQKGNTALITARSRKTRPRSQAK